QRRINSHFGFAETAAPYQKNGEPRHEEPGTPRVAAIHAKDQPDLSMAQETPPRVGETGGARERSIAVAGAPDDYPHHTDDTEHGKGIAPIDPAQERHDQE